MISAEQFAEWKTHPVTKEIFAGIKNVREELKEQLASGDTISDAEYTHGATNRVVGHIEGLNQLLNISYANDKELVDEVNNQSGY